MSGSKASRDDVWPLFERNGSRVVGQWKIIDSKIVPPEDLEDVYRLVRYASIEHWQATRFQTTLVGNGPAFEKELEGRKNRAALEKDSRGIFFLQGKMAPGGPYFMPGLAEKYELVDSHTGPEPTDSVIPVRVDVAQATDEIVEIRFQRIKKGAFDEVVADTETNIWPWEEKLGARPVGQWLVIYPTGVDSAERSRGIKFVTMQSAQYDEVITITRYANRSHYDAMRPERAVKLGGNGPDWNAWRAALDRQRGLTTLTDVEIAKGFMYSSPPEHLPAMPERYRLAK